jgi:hypothetical protein
MAITQGQITLDEAATIDKRLQTVTRTSGDTVHNEVMCLIDPDAASGDQAIATVPATIPALTARGLAVWPIVGNRAASGALGALNDAVTVAGEGSGAINWEVDTGTLSGTVVFEATLDDTNWFAIDAIRIDGTIITSITSFPDRGALTSSGYSQVRLRVSVYTSGTSNGRVEASVGTGVVRLGDSLPAGTNNIGDVDIASLPDEGQQSMANSISVAIASDQSAVPVSATNLDIRDLVPAQDTVQIGDGVETALVTAAGSLAIDIAEATATVTVDSELPAAAALSDAFANPTAPAVGAFLMAYDGATDWERVQVTGGGLHIHDGGNIITVDGTVTADAGTGPWPVTDNAGSLTVDAPVATPVAVRLSDGAAFYEAPLRQARESAFAEGVSALAELDDTATVTPTEGQMAPLRITAERSLHVELRSGTGEIGVIGTPLRVDPTGTTTQPVSATDLDIRNLVPAQDTVQIGDGVETALVTAAGSLAIDIAEATASVTVTATNLDIRDLSSAQDSVDTELAAAAALSDAFANPTTAPVGAFLMGYDGTDWERVRVTNLGQLHVDVQNATLEVVGDVADDIAMAGNPLPTGAIARNVDRTAVGNLDATYVLADLLGKLVTMPYAVPERMISGVGTRSSSTFSDLIAAGGASTRNYITSLSASNTNATTDVRVDFRDGAAGDVLSFWLAANGGGASHVMPTPWRLGLNNALQAALSAAVTDVRVSAQGFRANI